MATRSPPTDAQPLRHRILVVADRHLVGEAVRMALTSRGAQAACITLPETGIEQQLLMRWVATYRPDVGLVLCEAPEVRFVTRAVVLINRVPLVWLVLTASADPRRWGELLAAGAVGVLPMTSTLAELANAVDQAARGEPTMRESVRLQVLEMWHVDELSRRELNLRLRQLTPRERAVLDDLARGRSVNEIAHSGDVAVLTVRTQVKAILRKLNVSSQLAAVAYYRSATEATTATQRAR